MTTPTPPDAVREANQALVMFASTLEHHFVNNSGNLTIAKEICPHIAAHIRVLLTRPSDARGREERIEYGAMWHEADVLTWDGDEKEARWYIDACKKEHPEGKHPTLVQRTVTTTEWTPLSPNAEATSAPAAEPRVEDYIGIPSLYKLQAYEAMPNTWLERLELLAGGEWDTSNEALWSLLRGLRKSLASPRPDATRGGREPETVPLSVALQAVHLALNASRDVQARDHAVRAFQDKYGSLWPRGTLLLRAAAEGQANE